METSAIATKIERSKIQIQDTATLTMPTNWPDKKQRAESRTTRVYNYIQGEVIKQQHAAARKEQTSNYQTNQKENGRETDRERERAVNTINAQKLKYDDFQFRFHKFRTN
jgi:hypothetical protein